ncbi:hypothetical protein HPB50_022371 [Hyalomma asiaticum]|uniref:Uncharacterized protein n=1 Tax=Hyalomma asiaticum TaxID=266040 RepID=A0ACB7S524_HYAAI|nr:hypothetical protein HPB50_022371 [Hyalomma asiaticum]
MPNPRGSSRSPRTGSPRPEVADESPSEEQDLSSIIGKTGPFHRTMLLYATFAMMVFSLHLLVFAAVEPQLVDHWCQLPETPPNTTLEEWKKTNIPEDSNGSFSRCLIYKEVPEESPPYDNETREAVPCAARFFNISNRTMSIVQEWDLVCDREWLYSVTSATFFCGSLFGLALSGLLADRLLPESPRWLITTLRIRQACSVVSLILRKNGAPPKTIRSTIKHLKTHASSMLLRKGCSTPAAADGRLSPRRRARAEEFDRPDKSMRELLVIFFTQYPLSNTALCLCWLSCSVTYYGIAYDVKAQLASNVFQFLAVAVAPVVAYFLIKWRGRRDVLARSLIFSSVCCFTVAVLPKDRLDRYLAIRAAWFFINLAYTVVFLYATEIYPTSIRALGFNCGAAFGRLGSVIAAIVYDNSLMNTYGARMIGFLALSLSCAVSGLLVTKLPETEETHLPEKIKPEQNIFVYAWGWISFCLPGAPTQLAAVPALEKPAAEVSEAASKYNLGRSTIHEAEISAGTHEWSSTHAAGLDHTTEPALAATMQTLEVQELSDDSPCLVSGPPVPVDETKEPARKAGEQGFQEPRSSTPGDSGTPGQPSASLTSKSPTEVASSTTVSPTNAEPTSATNTAPDTTAPLPEAGTRSLLSSPEDNAECQGTALVPSHSSSPGTHGASVRPGSAQPSELPVPHTDGSTSIPPVKTKGKTTHSHGHHSATPSGPHSEASTAFHTTKEMHTSDVSTKRKKKKHHKRKH